MMINNNNCYYYNLHVRNHYFPPNTDIKSY
jgi:hypothetical protein